MLGLFSFLGFLTRAKDEDGGSALFSFFLGLFSFYPGRFLDYYTCPGVGPSLWIRYLFIPDFFNPSPLNFFFFKDNF